MKINVVSGFGATKARVDFPTEDGRCIGKPIVCLTFNSGDYLEITADDLRKINKALKKELKKWEGFYGG